MHVAYSIFELRTTQVEPYSNQGGAPGASRIHAKRRNARCAVAGGAGQIPETPHRGDYIEQFKIMGRGFEFSHVAGERVGEAVAWFDS
ncbi:hypothetical protein DPMN_051858 [Dreissena polymorpha]|uniref:Uncharacterized protein n=1 Tax=Dreissena polymorpha TaxID=45954 RepID=A0A9D4CIL4_DREPO|nr:hypothetical protein DPMN_051858 [Dreissena polymorpha]